MKSTLQNFNKNKNNSSKKSQSIDNNNINNKTFYHKLPQAYSKKI